MTKHDITTSTHTKPARRRTAAFTLIELLTVIAIIGILAAILLATLGRVRSLAYQAVCTSNLRQWGLALQMYANENRNKIPYEGSDDSVLWAEVNKPNDANSWFNVLPPYVATPALAELPLGLGGLSNMAKANYFRDKKMIYHDPADKRKALTMTPGTYINPSYMMNSQLYESHAPGQAKNYPASGQRQLVFEDLRDRAPLSRIPFMTEAGWRDGDGGRSRVRGHGDGSTTNVDAGRHNGGANVVFLDSSVRKFKVDQINDTKKHEFLIWNPWTDVQGVK
ncbi:N-terminal cleavage protein [Opitutaceae bacterium TAV5]|nr:N-terminal cleavage protein [Opitutaceae bacterium TAV5]